MTNKTNIRRLNDQGLGDFASSIDIARQDPSKSVPLDILNNDDSTEEIADIFTIDLEKKFNDRLEFGEYIFQVIGHSGLDKYASDIGFWSWLALAYFDQFCPPSKPNRQEHYILSEGDWAQGGVHDLAYRHCAKTPTMLVARYGGEASFFLTGRPIHEMGEVVEQICSRRDLMRSENLQKVIRRLYMDPATGSPKKGCTSYSAKPRKLANGKWSESGKGAIRRLVDGVLPRLKLTYNLEIMSEDDLISAAGPEFSESKWHEKTGTGSK